MKVALGVLAATTFAFIASPAAASAGSWSAQVVIGHSQAETGYSSSTIATSANGASVAVWSAVQGSASRFLAAYQPPGKPWGAAHVLASKIHDGRIFAGISSNGRAAVVWTTAIGSGGVHYVVHTRSGWSANRAVAGTTNLDATTFTMAPSGTASSRARRRRRCVPAHRALSIAYVRKLTPSGSWGPALRCPAARCPSTRAGRMPRRARWTCRPPSTTQAASSRRGVDLLPGSVGCVHSPPAQQVGAGGSSAPGHLKPTPTFRSGVQTVRMYQTGAAIVWTDAESKTAYALVKTSTGPWTPTRWDISSLDR